MDLRAQVSRSGYELDEAQLRAIARLEELGKRRRGVYLHGSVGRGKSFLADALFEALPTSRKRRVHFHSFVQELHARISARLHERGAVTKALTTWSDGPRCWRSTSSTCTTSATRS